MNNKGFLGIISQVLNLLCRAFSLAAICFFILIGGFLLYYFLGIQIYKNNGEDYKPAVALYTIISPSMEPNIDVYDVIVAKKVNNMEDVEIGDVITFVSTSRISEGLIVTHRVVGANLNPDGVAFVTKGDNNVTEDEGTVTQSQMIGKVIFKIPKLGKVQFLLASKGGWFLVILLPALGVIIYDIIKLCKLVALKDKMKKERNKKELEAKENQNKQLLLKQQE